MRTNVLIAFLWIWVFTALNPVYGQADGFAFDQSKIHLAGGLRPFKSTINIEKIAVDRYEVQLRLHAPAASLPPDFNITFRFPKNKINQLWNSQTWSNKSSFLMPSYDRAAANFSIISGLTLNDQNQITFTSDDRFNSRFINTYVREENDTLLFGLGFFEDNPPVSKMQDYEVRILVDFRNVHFSKAIFEASKWRQKKSFDRAALRSKRDEMPVYSTWYPMHRNIPLENITRELDSLKAYGFNSIIVDDGWRSLVKLKVDTVYHYDDESLKTMELFDQKRKEMGMSLYLWYSLPFMGGNPVVSEMFKGKYLHYKAPLQIYVLDPRYPDVRKHLIGTYYNFYKRWQFDGFWFDFLNDFYPANERTEVSEDLGRDFIDVKLAIDTLMNTMTKRLKSVNPNVFMGQEFDPVGPDRNTYQNFLAGFVGVNSVNTVHEKMVNNRLLYGRFTPFMEIMAVHPRDKSEEVARKFQAIMFGVPHLSFFVSTLPADTKQTLKFWLNYWIENKDVLMNSGFEPRKVANHYPAVKVENGQKTIFALYGEYTFSLPTVVNHPIDVINSKETQLVSFVVTQPGTIYNYEIFNHLGVSLEKGSEKTKRKNTLEFTVPIGGFIRFSPN